MLVYFDIPSLCLRGWSTSRCLPCTPDQELGFNLSFVFPNEANQGLSFTCPDTWGYSLGLDYLAEPLVFHDLRLLDSRGVSISRIRRSPGRLWTCSSSSTAQGRGCKEESWERATFWHIKSSWKMLPEIKVGQGMGQGSPSAYNKLIQSPVWIKQLQRLQGQHLRWECHCDLWSPAAANDTLIVSAGIFVVVLVAFYAAMNMKAWCLAKRQQINVKKPLSFEDSVTCLLAYGQQHLTLLIL